MARKKKRTATPPATGRLIFETMAVADLIPHPRNPRRIAAEALAGLAKSVERYGLVEPIIVNRRTGFIVGGHQRARVLERQAVSETDVVVVDLDEAEEEALLVALNSGALQGVFTDDLAALIDSIAERLPDAATDLRLGDLIDELDAPPVRPVSVKPPPEMAWVLIGIEVGRWEEVAERVQDLGEVDGVIIETNLNAKTEADG